MNFVTLEANLFSLGLPDTYVALNDARSSEALIESTLDHVSSSLFSVLLTLEGQPPLIYASKGTSAELLGEKLETRIRNYLLNAKTSYLGTHSELAIEDSLQRPCNCSMHAADVMCPPPCRSDAALGSKH